MAFEVVTQWDVGATFLETVSPALVSAIDLKAAVFELTLLFMAGCTPAFTWSRPSLVELKSYGLWMKS